MKAFIKEFKEFALKGNVMDMAVGVIIGAAFQAIVSSLVDDIISPLIGCLVNINFSDLSFMVGDVAIGYGAFITAVINFLIMAFVIFLMLKAINKAASIGKKKEEAAPTVKTCPFCQSEINIKATRCPHCTSELK